MKFKNTFLIFGLFFITILFVACENPVEEKKYKPCDIETINPVSHPPYFDVTWHPSNKFIAFNYVPLDSITFPWGKHCPGSQYFNTKRRGFWIVDINGKNKRRIFPYHLIDPAWSPDGKWIAFNMGAQIYKMPFDINTEKFDTTKIVQLTFKGRNFFPAWSPDGKWIAYDSNKDSPIGMNFIWKMKSDGTKKIRIAYDPSNGEIRMPHWGKNNKITHIRAIVNNDGNPEIFQMDYNGNNIKQITKNKSFNLRPKYSPSESIIAFLSGSSMENLWLIDTKNLNMRRLTKDKVNGNDNFSWSPDGNKIVYAKHNFKDWSYSNGCLWVIDIYTGEEYQLTFNKKGGE